MEVVIAKSGCILHPAEAQDQETHELANFAMSAMLGVTSQNAYALVHVRLALRDAIMCTIRWCTLCPPVQLSPGACYVQETETNSLLCVLC